MAPESYRVSCDAKTVWKLVKLAPDAYCLVALHGYPCHMNGIVTAFHDAVFLATASVGPRQHRNTSFDFETSHATNLDAAAATGAFAGVYHRYPLRSHWPGLHRGLLDSLLYFTMIVPFIHGWGAHWKWTTPF